MSEERVRLVGGPFDGHEFMAPVAENLIQASPSTRDARRLRSVGAEPVHDYCARFDKDFLPVRADDGVLLYDHKGLRGSAGQAR